jgi:hypothetical protein
MVTLIGVAFYKFAIFMLIVKLFYRKTWLAIPPSVDEEGQEVEGQPSLLFDRDQIDIYGNLIPRNETGVINRQTYLDDKNPLAVNAGFEIVWEASLFSILIIDFFCQIVSIMIFLFANFLIDFGRPTATDRMAESKYFTKLVTMIMTSICTNIAVSYVIYHED